VSVIEFERVILTPGDEPYQDTILLIIYQEEGESIILTLDDDGAFRPIGSDHARTLADLCERSL
jgi:hypothetical protein